MTRHLLYFLLLIGTQVRAQSKTVTLKGIIHDSTVKTIKISYVTDDKFSKWDVRNLSVIDGEFTTTIQIPFPVEMNIEYNNKLYRKNYIYTDAKIEIDITGKLRIIDSPIQNEYENEFLTFFKSNDEDFNFLQSFYQINRQKYGSDLPKSVKDSAALLREKYYSQRAELLEDYIRLHSNSYVALWDLNYFASITPVYQYFNFEKLLSLFSDQIQQEPFIITLRLTIQNAYKIQTGNPFPIDFFRENEQLKSNLEKNNKYYLIDFWYSHCRPCIVGFPKLKNIYTKFHHKGFDIVSISVDDQKNRKDYEKAIKKYQLIWKHVWDKDGSNSKKFNVQAFPTYILIDKNGQIIHNDISASDLEKFLSQNL